MAWTCNSFVNGLSYKCINVCKKVKLINHDCLPILILLYIILYIMLAYLMLYRVLAYLMLFAALSNAVCLYDAFFPFLLLICANAF